MVKTVQKLTLMLILTSMFSLNCRIVEFEKVMKNSSAKNAVRALNAMVEELSKDKLVVVDFWTSPCPGCNEIAGGIRGLERKFGDRVVFVKVSVKSKFGSQFIKQYQIRSVPRLLVYKQEKLVDDIVTGNKNQLAKLVEKHL